MGIRPSKEEIDAAVLDVAAGLLARRGVKGTSIQAVADATGYSKAGILNRFTSKGTLIGKSVEQCRSQTHDVLCSVSDLPGGPARDAASLVALTDLALRRPGYISLVSAFATPLEEPHLQREVELLGSDICRMFCLPEPGQGSLERRCRVIGALGALCTLAVAGPDDAAAPASPETRPHILATAWSTLGHGMALSDAR
ncbi:TetR/AcrR family transcriptional regulator [Streptomyces solisilvae]|uniref:TetR/AcrR family transcriptional regulator n=1 Tax=Streptomyces malaysiensis TaxID=92644 RepID=UPI0036839685